MRKLLALFSFFILFGCPVYDPPAAVLGIKNLSQHSLYVYLTCNEELPCEPLKLYFRIGENAYDANGHKIKDTLFYPNYRIAPESEGSIVVDGTPGNPKVYCDNDRIKIYFLTEKVIRENAWEKICQQQLYAKKMIFSQQQLDDMNWKIVYK